VTRTLSTALEAQVHYATSDGTARANVDYTPAEGDLVFKVGETTKTFTVAINGDLALTSTRLPDGTVTSEIARRQSDGTWLWVIDRYSVAW